MKLTIEITAADAAAIIANAWGRRTIADIVESMLREHAEAYRRVENLREHPITFEPEMKSEDLIADRRG